MNHTLGVHGAGLVGAHGRGLRSLPSGPPTDASGGTRVLRVALETLKDAAALKKLRRADRFSKMSALAAWDAAACAARRPDTSAGRLGIVVASAFGPHRTTFAFLDDILDFGDAAVSPTTFSHSVHNAAAAYIALMLDCDGPACTVTAFERPLLAGLRTAAVWLHEGRCDRVLAAYTEEASPPMEYILTTLAPRHTGLPVPDLFRFSILGQPALSEGSLCFLLSRREDGGTPLDLTLFENKVTLAEIVRLLHHLEA